MRPTKQLFRHAPDQGIWGDCERAAWATILDLDINDVPHFFDGGCSTEDAMRKEREFESSLGLYHVALPFVASNGLDAVLSSVGHNNPNAEYLLMGQSKTGCNHTVVCRGSAIIHDPSLDDAGIIGPCDDGWYWLVFFTRAPTSGSGVF
jgi:hypothetical protein